MMAVSLLKKNELDFVSKLLNLKYKKREIKTRNVKNIKTNTPLSGSFANVCTEFKMPDLTKNVPLILKIKVLKASMIVHDLRVPLLSKTEEQCNSAVRQNQGIKETFSTGSQNQNPPQPNS